MKVKLTKIQLEGLHEYVTHGLEEFDPTSVADKLLWVLVDRLNEKLRLKVRKIRSTARVDVVFTWKDDEACAFFCWHQTVNGLLPDDVYRYERMVADKVYGEIDRVLG